MSNEEILNEANYCLQCKNKPCSINGCPMNTKIPEFIKEIKENNFEKAYNILIENNILSHVCSLICPQENLCERVCIRGIKGKPTKIGFLESKVNEFALKNNLKPNLKIQNKINKKVAIVGTGPSRNSMRI